MFGYFFLRLFVLMASLNIALFCQIWARNRLAGTVDSDAFRSEKC